MRLGKTQKKILLILLGGIALGFSGSPKRYFKILNYISKEWKNINRSALKRSAVSLYKLDLVKEVEYDNGAKELVLTEKGRELAIGHNFKIMKIKIPKKWDRKWRMVIFDIPEIYKKKREILRFRLKNMNFYEFQKSVFVHPFDCKKEVEYIANFYGIEKFIRFIIAGFIDEETVLKKRFDLR